MDYGEEARKILERNNYYGHVCLTAAIAAALKAAAEDGAKETRNYWIKRCKEQIERINESTAELAKLKDKLAERISHG